MRSRFTRGLLTTATAGALAVSLLFNGPTNKPAQASSHREAPLITADPLADNTDVYAFRSYEAGRGGFVTLIANWIPFEEPSGGPHFYRFDDTVLYEIKIDNTGDGVEDITYQFTFNTIFVNGDSVLGLAAPNEALAGTRPLEPVVQGLEPLITSLTDPDLNEKQFYTVRVAQGPTNGMVRGTILASNVPTAPSHVGIRTTGTDGELGTYESNLGLPAVRTLASGARVFAGQRDEGFYLDVGGLFDTINYASGGISETGGIDGLAGFNVNTIAFEAPIQVLTGTATPPTSVTDPDAVIGVWATASRQTTRVIRPTVGRGRGITLNAGPFRQVSRLANPLVNELVVPLRLKDTFNATTPATDAVLAPFILDPQLPRLIQAVLAADANPANNINIPPPPRNDLVLIFATGIPAGLIPGFTNFLSDGQPHEMQRLNVAIPPSGSPSRLGLLGGDLAGYPNGRRVFDDVPAITQRAAVGGTPLTPAFNVFPNNMISDGVSDNDVPYLNRFPYLGVPQSGNVPPGKPHEHHRIGTGTRP